MVKTLGKTRDGLPPSKLRLGSVRSLVLLLCFSSLGLMATRQWQDLRRSDRYLNTSLIAQSSADYSASRPTNLAAQVGLGVIEDMVRDSQPDFANLPVRLNSVHALLQAFIHSETSLPGLRDSKLSIQIPAPEKVHSTQPAVHPSWAHDPNNSPTALASASNQGLDSEPKASPKAKATDSRDPQKASAPKADKADKTDKSGKSDKSDKSDNSGNSSNSKKG